MKVLKIKKYKYRLQSYEGGECCGNFEVIIRASKQSNAEERAEEIAKNRGFTSVTLIGIEECLADICPGCGKPTIDWDEAEPMCDECGWAQ